MAQAFTFRPLGFLRTPFRERNGTPRQSLLAPHVPGLLRIGDAFHPQHSLANLDEYSHAWLLFVFDRNTNEHKLRPVHGPVLERDEQSPHPNPDDEALLSGGHQHSLIKSKITPPRLDGRKKVGLFATRTPHRPNPIGLSLVRIAAVDLRARTVMFSGVDLVDGTPILDIKPYHVVDRVPTSTFPSWLTAGSCISPVSDALSALEAVQQAPPPPGRCSGGEMRSAVSFTPSCMAHLQHLFNLYTSSEGRMRCQQPYHSLYNTAEALARDVSDVLACEIRPAHKRVQRPGEAHGLWFDVFNFVFHYDVQTPHAIEVFNVELWPSAKKKQWDGAQPDGLTLEKPRAAGN